MKNIMWTLAFLFVGVSAQAQILGSQLAPRHQALLEKVVSAHCGLTRGEIAEVSTKATPIRIDQGITDVVYETELEVRQRVDQLMYDVYAVKVVSTYADTYDHSEKDWGIYSVESISDCIQK